MGINEDLIPTARRSFRTRDTDVANPDGFDASSTSWASRHLTASSWEAGSSSPKPEHLKEVIALAVKSRAFPEGHEATEIRVLWKAARQKELLDERWLFSLLDDLPSPPASLVPPTAKVEHHPDQRTQ